MYSLNFVPAGKKSEHQIAIQIKSTYKSSKCKAIIIVEYENSQIQRGIETQFTCSTADS